MWILFIDFTLTIPIGADANNVIKKRQPILSSFEFICELANWLCYISKVFHIHIYDFRYRNCRYQKIKTRQGNVSLKLAVVL